MYKYTKNENISILVLNTKKNSFPGLFFVGGVVFLVLPSSSWSLRWFRLRARSLCTFFFHKLPLKFSFFLVGRVVFLVLPSSSWSLRWFRLRARSLCTFFFHKLPLKFFFFLVGRVLFLVLPSSSWEQETLLFQQGRRRTSKEACGRRTCTSFWLSIETSAGIRSSKEEQETLLFQQGRRRTSKEACGRRTCTSFWLSIETSAGIRSSKESMRWFRLRARSLCTFFFHKPPLKFFLFLSLF